MHMETPSSHSNQNNSEAGIQQSHQAEHSSSDPKWIDNQGQAVEKVFGFNENAELVNGRAAMFGFLMLVITELVFGGEAVTKSLFGIS